MAAQAGPDTSMSTSDLAAVGDASRRDRRTPGWAAKFRRAQRLRDAVQTAVHTLKEGDQGGQSTGPKLGEDA